MQTLSEVLRERGYVYQFSSETLEEITDGPKRTVYLGIDPSADSLHVGHLQAMLVLRRFAEDGHAVILLVGGGTGMIGDPSGKSEERNLLDAETIANNAAAVSAQAQTLFAGGSFTMVNNLEWLSKLDLISFLRDIGKYFSVNAMLQRDSVRERLQNQEQGISYTEFSYMLLQAYDFLHLHQEKQCDVQIGASDQWGNMVSGIDLIRRKTGRVAYAFSLPLLINAATGKKFGKSEGGAVWLDAKKTSPFQFYQFWLNTDDEAVEEYLLKMTTLPASDIASAMEAHNADKGRRAAQRLLARTVTALVHGESVAVSVEKVSEALFGSADLATLGPAERDVITREAPSCIVRRGEVLSDVLVRAALATSKREARQFIDDGAVTLNGAKVSDANRELMQEDFQTSPIALLKRGKRNVSILSLE